LRWGQDFCGQKKKKRQSSKINYSKDPSEKSYLPKHSINRVSRVVYPLYSILSLINHVSRVLYSPGKHERRRVSPGDCVWAADKIRIARIYEELSTQQIKPVSSRQLAKAGRCGKYFAQKLIKELQQETQTVFLASP
jgi:hypothetical protein